MRKCHALMIFLASSLLLVLQTLEVVDALECYGSFINSNSTYAQNRLKLFATLSDKVATNGGFYNTSLGRNPNRVHALVLCARGFDRQACINCVENWTQGTQANCPNRRDSFMWGSDDADSVSCLVRFSNHSIVRNLELNPPFVSPSQDSIESSKNRTLFEQQWEDTVNRTLEAATKAENSSVHKFYSAVVAEFTEFSNVYMLMQCTPDITSGDCKICLEDCVMFFRENFGGKKGGMVSRPSCFFRWDLFDFHGAFDNVTSVPARPRPQAHVTGSSTTHEKGRSIGYGGVAVIIVVLTVIYLLVFIGFIKVYARRRKPNNGINGCSAEYSDSDGQVMLRFDLGMILIATNDFSSENMLGQGGFGTVSKGTLSNGQEIAVKRLTKGGSGQGDMEFKNEVSLLTRLQHRNLVKLLGFCIEEDEEILVYEFVPNSSLDHFIFDKEKRSLLTWEVRCIIVEGIARGLVYLHEDSQLKIIHRDLKPSNILLDAEMNPKVADFGTARLFNTDVTRVETGRIAGTRGYIAPEYLNHGQISAKSDVFSFGVMLLEMISGERNNSFEGGLADFTWKGWVEGKLETVIDPLLIEDPIDEIIKMIQIGLLCVQENATKRPTISLVIVWLGSETVIIPLPNPPAFNGSQSRSEDGSMSMSDIFTELSSR